MNSSIEKSGGGPLPENHRDINPATGQQKAYIVLTPEERAKGFVEPVRAEYVHLKCGTRTIMGRDLAETYARDPEFYSGTFCAGCRAHFPLIEFVWDGTQQTVGTRSPPAATASPLTSELDETTKVAGSGGVPEPLTALREVLEIAIDFSACLATRMDAIADICKPFAERALGAVPRPPLVHSTERSETKPEAADGGQT